MKRRSFLKKAGAALAAGSAAGAPTVLGAQTSSGAPAVSWRMVLSWPRNLDALYGGVELIAKRVAAATNGKFEIKIFAAGEIVGGLQVLDTVQAGTVECGHTVGAYYVGKDPTFTFFSSPVFGLNPRQQNAWMHHAGGMALMRDFYREFNCHVIRAGTTGIQWGGFFRKPVNTVADLKGLKMRIGAAAGLIAAKLGMVPQQLAAGDIYPSLEKGTLDAVKWVGPYDDEKLGFHKVASNYYYPGFWDGSPDLTLLVNIRAWEALPKEYQTILELACAEAHIWILAKYDASNLAPLKRLVSSGTKVHPFSREIMAAAYKATLEVYDDLAAKNAKFKKVYEPWKKFREEQVQWFSLSENYNENFISAALRQSPEEKK